MTAGLELLAILAGLYLWQCSVKLPGRTLLVRGAAGRRPRIERSHGGQVWLSLRPGAITLRAHPGATAPEAFDEQALTQRLDELRSGTEALARASDGYALVLFVAGPAVLLAYGDESGLARRGVAGAVLHLVTWGLYWRSLRALEAERGRRVELLIAAAIFPPSLLRARQEMADLGLGAPHPAALVACLLPKPRVKQFLAREVARAERDRRRGVDGAAPELEGLVRLAERIGIDLSELRSPPARRDPLAARYCPVCGSEFLPGFARCAECEERTRRFPAEA